MRYLTVLAILIALAFPPAVAAGNVTVLAGAGDIASCTSDVDSQTAQLIEHMPHALVFTLGDNVYVNGTAKEYANCYAPTWGQFRDRTRPIPGNHDYGLPGGTPDPSGYFGYFGTLAGTCCLGYYSYDVNGWRIYALDSEINTGKASAQYAWLKQQLDSDPHECTIAMWHRPRFTSDLYTADATKMGAIFSLLYARHAELVLNGHVHAYERMARQNPSGQPDPLGVRTIVAGMGGREDESPGTWGPPLPVDEVRDNQHFGVLKLQLAPSSYSWKFVATDGTDVDTGSDVCTP